MHTFTKLILKLFAIIYSIFSKIYNIILLSLNSLYLMIFSLFNEAQAYKFENYSNFKEKSFLMHNKILVIKWSKI